MRPLYLVWPAAVAIAFGAGFLSRSGNSEPAAGSEIDAPKVTASNLQLSAALRLANHNASAQALAAALLRMDTSEEFVAAFTELRPNFADPRIHDSLFLLADAWAVKDPAFAADWLNALKFDDLRNPYLFSALSQWASQDPAAAAAWLEKNPSAQAADYLLAALVRGTANSDPGLALRILLAAPDSPERSGSIDFITRVWLSEGFDAATAKLSSIPASESKLRERAIAALINGATQESFGDITAWISSLVTPGYQLAATSTAAARWSRDDPMAVRKWADGIVDPGIRSVAYGEMATLWARRDPLAAGEWLLENNDRPDLDLAARAVAWSTVGIDGKMAFTQVSKITDSALRLETYEQLARVWMSDQPLDAREYLESENHIPEELRLRLLSSYQ